MIGIHAEGPIIATLGGLPQSDAHMPLDEFCKLLDALGPALRVMTIAPSVDAPELLRMKELVKRGIIPGPARI